MYSHRLNSQVLRNVSGANGRMANGLPKLAPPYLPPTRGFELLKKRVFCGWDCTEHDFGKCFKLACAGHVVAEGLCTSKFECTYMHVTCLCDSCWPRGARPASRLANRGEGCVANASEILLIWCCNRTTKPEEGAMPRVLLLWCYVRISR